MTQNGVPAIVALQYETVWLDANRYVDAERQFHEVEAQQGKKERSKIVSRPSGNEAKPKSSLACEIANARERIKNFLKNGESLGEGDGTKDILERIKILEKEKATMKEKLAETTSKLEEVLTKFHTIEAALRTFFANVEKERSGGTVLKNGPAAATADDDDVDLFGSDEETEEEARVKMERLKAYENKKAKKPALIAKSSVVLDVKPWSDETDMKELEMAVKKIELDGLKWGAAKLVPLAYGIHKLQIIAIVEDDKVSIDWLQESIQDIEELVQSVDIAAFNKL